MSADCPSLLAPGTHCRICGSSRLNRFNHAFESSDKVSIHQILAEDNSVDQLIKPCNCRGDFAYAHSICLSDWIETTRHQYCDVCRFRYEISFLERSFFDWILEKKQVGRILNASAIAFLIYYTSFVGIIAHGITKGDQSTLSSIVLLSAYSWMTTCTLYLVIKAYILLQEFKLWKQANRRVLVGPNKNPQLTVSSGPKDVLKSSGFKIK